MTVHSLVVYATQPGIQTSLFFGFPGYRSENFWTEWVVYPTESSLCTWESGRLRSSNYGLDRGRCRG